MNLETIHKILETVNIAGIKQIVIDKLEDGICVRGIDEGSSKVVVISKMKGNIIEETVGINKVGNLLNRLNLFNLSSTKTEVEITNDSYIKSAVFLEGRKKGFVQFANPDKLGAPSGIQSPSIVNRVVLDTDKVKTITGAVSALQPEHITFVGEGDDVLVEIKEKDGNDKFVDLIGTNESGDWINNWDVQTFARLLKSANKGDQDVPLNIDKTGMMYVLVNDIEFTILPAVVK